MVSPFPRSGLAVGGVAAAVETLVLEISTRRDIEAIEVVSLRGDIGQAETLRINSKLAVHYLPGQRRGVKLTFGAWDYVRTRRIASKFGPTVVHGQGLSSEGDMATRLGFPSVVTIHGMVHLEARNRETTPVFGRLRVALVESMVQRVLRRAGVVISISDYDQRMLAGRIPGSVMAIPNAVRPDFFADEFEPSPSHRVLFAGLLVPRKNVCGIIRAFARVQAAVPQASLELAGDAPDKAYLENVMAEVRNQGAGAVAYLGNLTRDDLLARMRQTAVVVLFSEQETLPCIIAEAMASSRAVVSSSVGGIPEMVIDGHNGLLVRPGDEASLAACLITLLRNPDLRRAMGERGHAIASARWSPARIADDTIKAYRAALEP